ncbi:MAG TPA: class I SAM-dependent methyltransferase [Candidatus Acidoferrales bacterium]|nr:class I SAM-dependent methyltransferase [Candidatus Acidoferrales bacterium]
MTTSSPAEPEATDQPNRYLPGMKWAAAEAIGRYKALHNVGELSALLAILGDLEPKVVLEIGTWAGGSAWAFSRIPTVSHIVTVDLEPRPEAAEQLAQLPCRAEQVTGDSQHPTTFKQVRALLDGFRPDVVFIDGAHDYVHARKDWELYGPLVQRGGVVVLHDTQGYPGVDMVQVPQLWAEVRQNYRTTELIDTLGGPGGTGIVWF